MRSASLLTPIFDRLKTYLLSEPLIHGDETRLQVLKEAGKKAQSQSYMWVYRSGEHSKTPVVLFEYQPNRSEDNPIAFLSGRSGTLMSDGYSAWRMRKGIKSLGCFAHACRKFNDVVKIKGNHCAEAQKAIDMISQLYKIEKESAESTSEERYEARQTNALPILNELKVWLEDKAINEVNYHSLFIKAVKYTLNQWPYLIGYTENGDWPIDNNLVERDIRPVVIGRKNWLFSDSVEGAHASALIFSLVLTCRANQISPYAWLHHVFKELPQREKDVDITDLMPFNFVEQAQN